MAITKDKKKNGEVRWKAVPCVNGKRIGIKRFKTKAEAIRYEAETVAKYSNEPESQGKEKKVSFNDLLDKFRLIHLPTIKEGTADRYEIDLKYRIEPFFRYMPLVNINPQLVEEFRSRIMRDRKLSKKSINNCMGVLSVMFTCGERWRMVDKSPVVTQPLKIERVEYGWWHNSKDIMKFLNCARENSRYYSLFLTAIETGMRLGELIGLSKQDINFDFHYIKVHRQWLDKKKRYGSCKGNNIRTIPISEELAEILRNTVNESPHPEAIFVTRTGNRAMGRKVSGVHFKHLVKKSGVPDIKFHDVRHSFASHYMKNGGQIWDLKQILGHSSVKMTERYAHLAPDYVGKVLVKFSGFAPNLHQKGELRVI